MYINVFLLYGISFGFRFCCLFLGDVTVDTCTKDIGSILWLFKFSVSNIDDLFAPWAAVEEQADNKRESNLEKGEKCTAFEDYLELLM